MKILTALLFLICVAYASNLASEYKLLKEFYREKDPDLGYLILREYPNAVFSEDLKVEVAYLYLQRGNKRRARKILENTDLSKVRDDLGDKATEVWRSLLLPRKPLVLRFPEKNTDLLEYLSFTQKERESIVKRLLRFGKLKEALNLTEDMCHYRGKILYRLKRYEEALKVLKDCPEESSEIYYLLSLISLKRLEDAQIYVRKKNKDHLYIRLARYYLSRGNLKEARKLFLMASNSFEGTFYRALIDYATGNYLLAYEGFSRLIERAKNPRDLARASFWKFKTLSAMGVPDLAQKYLRISAKGEGFYGAVARSMLDLEIFPIVRYVISKEPSYRIKRLKAIADLGFFYYMRKEALLKADLLSSEDLVHLSEYDPHLAIKIAVRRFGTDSVLYRALAFPTPYRNIVRKVSLRFGVEEALIYAVMRQESLFDPLAVSPSGALGLMQLLEKTAKWQAEKLGMEVSREDLFDPETNITLGTAYLSFLINLWKGNLPKAVASYNAGQGAVSKWNLPQDDYLFIEMIPYSETRKYTKRVLWFYYVYSERL